MKKNIIKSLILTCCIFVFGIGSAFALKNTNVTYAANYSARFYANGGTWADGNTASYKTVAYDGKYYFTQSYIKISKSGCTFEGWRVGSTTGNLLTQFVDSAENNKNLYASWINCSSTSEKKYYTITFNTNGGSGSFSTQQIQEGLVAIEPARIPTRSGYTFRYWSTSQNGSAYNFNTKVTSNLTLYAVWKVDTKKYTVTFYKNDGSSSYESKTVTEGNTVSKPSNPTRNGYIFKYWSTSQNGSAYNFNTKVTSNLTLYAVWERETTETPKPNPTPSPAPSPTPPPAPSVTYYTVKFNLNGGSGNISSQSIARGNKVTPPTDNPVKKNAAFSGWYTSEKCTTKYDFDKSVTSNLTLYACYVNNYKVTFDLQGLPYISSYTKNLKENSNLLEYNVTKKINIVNSETYKMLNINDCSSTLKKINPNSNSNVIKNKCNGLDEMFDCTKKNNTCHANKYIEFDETEIEELLYLKTNKIIDFKLDTYNYLGLYSDKECKKEYSYKNKITKNITVYECYKLNSENDNKTDVENKPNNNKKKNTGATITIVMILIAFLSLVGFIAFLITKGKIANKVD